MAPSDSCPIHAITTASLERLRPWRAGLDFAAERSRPNLLFEPEAGAEGFVEGGLDLAARCGLGVNWSAG